MQTFLPYNSYHLSARVLDNKRLGKQRVETLQILKALRLPHYGWKNHPAVRMWQGYEYALCCYGLDICSAWRQRGFADTVRDQLEDIREQIRNELASQGKHLVYYPAWVADPRLPRSHQSNLVRKDPEHYRDFFPTVPDNIPYWWPTKEQKYAPTQAA